MGKQEAYAAIVSVIDQVTDPKRMSKSEYKDLLEEVAAEIEGRLDAVKDELRDEG